jgi:hypothetical protein
VPALVGFQLVPSRYVSMFRCGDAGISSECSTSIIAFLLVKCFLYYFLLHSGDEEEEPPINVTALTGTSRTLVLSETRPTTDETSPPQRDIGHLTPVGSPRAPSPKRARIELGKDQAS